MPYVSTLILTAAAAGSSYAALEAYGAPAPPAYDSPSTSGSAPAQYAPAQSFAPKSAEHSSHEPQRYSSPAKATEYTTTQAAEYPSQTYGFEAPETSCTEEEKKSTSTFVPWYTNLETTQLASVFSMQPTISIDTASYVTTSASVKVPYHSKNVPDYPEFSSSGSTPAPYYPKETPTWSKPEEHKTYPQEHYASESASSSAPVDSWTTTEGQKQSYQVQTWSTEEAMTYTSQSYQQTGPTEAPSYPATWATIAPSSAPIYTPESKSSGSIKYVYSTLTNTVTCESCQPTAPATWATTASVYVPSASAPAASSPVGEYQPSAGASEAYPVMSKETPAPSAPVYSPQASAPASALVMEMQPSGSSSVAYPGVPKASWVPAPTYSASNATATKHLTIVPVPATMATYPAGAASPTGASSYSSGTGNSTKPWNQPASYTGSANVNTFSIAALTIAIFGAAFAL